MSHEYLALRLFTLTLRQFGQWRGLYGDCLDVKRLLIGLTTVLQEGPLQAHHRHAQGYGGGGEDSVAMHPLPATVGPVFIIDCKCLMDPFPLGVKSEH